MSTVASLASVTRWASRERLERAEGVRVHAECVLEVLSSCWQMCMHTVQWVTTAHERTMFSARPAPRVGARGVRVRGRGDARTGSSSGGGGGIDEGGRHWLVGHTKKYPKLD